MADYTRAIGGNTTLMIRDLGGWVEFWVKTGPQTWNYEQQWSYFANGAESGIRRFRMLAGGNWQHFGSVYVAYNQAVRFTIFNAGLGFPTYDFWQDISRSTVPESPHIWQAEAISASHIRVSISDGHDGGSGIVERQLGYGTNPDNPDDLADITSGTIDGGPFASGARIFFWARNRNGIGWSDWSDRADARTWRTPPAPTPVSFLDVDQTSVRIKFSDRGDGGQPILERQLGYGTNPSAPVSTMDPDGSGIDDVTGLDPGKLYYFWVRSRNSIGWGPWSPRSEVLLIAGARVFTAGEWKRAVPYVKVAGVWKVVRPWVRHAGVWKETSL